MEELNGQDAFNFLTKQAEIIKSDIIELKIYTEKYLVLCSVRLNSSNNIIEIYFEDLKEFSFYYHENYIFHNIEDFKLIYYENRGEYYFCLDPYDNTLKEHINDKDIIKARKIRVVTLPLTERRI